MSTKKVTSKKVTSKEVTSKEVTSKKVTSKEVTSKEVTKKINNPSYSLARLTNIVKKDVTLDIEELDKMLINCNKSCQLNQLNKDVKIIMTVYYLLHQYKGAISKKLQLYIRRFIEDNERFYNKDDKQFDDEHFELNVKLVDMQKTKERTLKDIQDEIDKLPTKVGIDKLYSTYCDYQRNKKSSDKSLYEDVYKMHIAKWLYNNNIMPSENLLVFLANEVTTKLNTKLSTDVDKEKSNLKITFDKKEFSHYFIATFVDLLIDKHIINKKSYLTNKDFLESLKTLEVKKSLAFLQDVIEQTGVEVED